MGFHRINALLESLITLPDRLDARLAVPRPGSASPQLRQAPDSITPWRWPLRRAAMLLHDINGVPLAGVKPHCTRHLWIRATHHGARVDTPGHHHVDRQGVQQPLIGLHAPLCDFTPLLAHPEKPCYCPATAIPAHDRTRPGQIRHGETREHQPLNGFLALGWSAFLGLDSGDLNGRQCTAHPTCPMERYPLGRYGKPERPPRPVRLAGQLAGHFPQRAGLLHLGPPMTLRSTCGSAPIPLGTNAILGPSVWLAASCV